MNHVILFSGLLIAGLMLSAGCASTPSPQTQNTTVISNTPTPESTFVSPTRSGATSTVTPAPALTATHQMDYIIGTWKAYSVPYDCTAFFSRGSSGFLKCGVSIVSETKQFSWENEGSDGNGGTNYQATEYTTDQGVTPTTIDLNINSSGYMFSSSLPSNAYLIKMPGN